MSNETERQIILQPITMAVPNRAGIYAPSRIAPTKTITYREFLYAYGDHPRKIKASFAADGISNSQYVTAYGNGMDCWYIITDSLTPIENCDTVAVRGR